MEIFDEDKAVEYILNRLKEESIDTPYKADDILEVIDIIWDYYEDHGMLNVDFGTDEDDLATADESTMKERENLISHVEKLIRKDKHSSVRIEDIPVIVNAELDYEDSLEF